MGIVTSCLCGNRRTVVGDSLLDTPYPNERQLPLYLQDVPDIQDEDLRNFIDQLSTDDDDDGAMTDDEIANLIDMN